jgi:hypothetical protein
VKYEYRVEDWRVSPSEPLEREINALAAEGYRLLSLADHGGGSGWWWVAVFERPSAEERNATYPR